MSNTKDLIKQYSTWEKTRPKSVNIVPKPMASSTPQERSELDKSPVYTSTEILPTYQPTNSSSVNIQGNQQTTMGPEKSANSGVRKNSDTELMLPPPLPAQAGKKASVFGMKRTLQPGAGMADVNTASWWRGNGQGRLW